MSASVTFAGRRVGVISLYNPGEDRKSSSWGSDKLEIRCGRENQHPERLGPQAPGWAAQENGKETRLWPIEWGVNMLQFCSVSYSLSHTTLSITWEVYFSKELCSSSLLCCCVLHADVCVLCGYKTLGYEFYPVFILFYTLKCCDIALHSCP